MSNVVDLGDVENDFGIIAADNLVSSEVRKVWYQGEWYYSVVDIIAHLLGLDYKQARNYWKVLRHRLIQENNPIVSKCHKAKLIAKDGKQRMTDICNELIRDEIIKIVRRISYNRVKRIHKKHDEIINLHPVVVDYFSAMGWNVKHHITLPSGKEIDIVAERQGEKLLIECKKDLRGTYLYRAIGQILCYVTEYGMNAKPTLVCLEGKVDNYGLQICNAMEISILTFPK